MLLGLRIFLIFIWINIVIIPGFITLLFWPRNPNILWACSRLVSIVSFYLMGIEYEMRDSEIFDGKRPAIIISNHQSMLDFLTCCGIIAPRTVSVGKHSILKIPFYGLAYWLSGNILINRKKTKKAHRTINKISADMIDRDLFVWIMPEGTRSYGEKLHKFKKGAFHAAIAAEVPIIPVCISTYKKSINLKKWKSGKIIAQVLPPISTDGMDKSDVTALSEKCHNIINETIEKLDMELT
ncbi:MAG: 1-acylglycerol-3-phosphate O-acyltransferase [Bacteriovoracaceae bacterium]|nr:1-acylglycerol-3-phosphate O-acyltransferase [Bacteriovoracaceae bacterium]